MLDQPSHLLQRTAGENLAPEATSVSKSTEPWIFRSNPIRRLARRRGSLGEFKGTISELDLKKTNAIHDILKYDKYIYKALYLVYWVPLGEERGWQQSAAMDRPDIDVSYWRTQLRA
ncbi:hypothetical protein J7337_011531 [Fusarium musae]|uniref:Uncharacterized protein n=1 Tax=Fusarium musae TaxID=1042133 RepID=A0A9P8IL39_9HYPO|nr:hypothetical protein J7337_011531 [Fusarium musae]KAG9496748.1 hypothetical protein J7337_011531 [Fusarium musae]